MERVTGIGGIFFKARDEKALRQWYREHLGIEPDGEWGTAFAWPAGQDEKHPGTTVWAVFPEATRHFEPSQAPFMINYRVRDLRAMLAQLRAAGAAVDEKVDESEFGKFGWARDPEGNRFELWEPPEGS